MYIIRNLPPLAHFEVIILFFLSLQSDKMNENKTNVMVHTCIVPVSEFDVIRG